MQPFKFDLIPALQIQGFDLSGSSLPHHLEAY
jgi:hypothetical protein